MRNERMNKEIRIFRSDAEERGKRRLNVFRREGCFMISQQSIKVYHLHDRRIENYTILFLCFFQYISQTCPELVSGLSCSLFPLNPL